MAVIEKIRGKAGLLIGIVGFSLVAFILGDFLSSNSGFFTSSDRTVGEINGKSINVLDFEAKVQTSVENYKMQNNTETVDQNAMDQVREQTWNQLINDMVMKPEFEKLGITCSPKELLDMVQGKNPHPEVKRAFSDPKTGAFNPANVANFLKNMDNDQTGRARKQWLNFENAIREERIQQKYNTLIRQGLYVTTDEAKDDFLARNKSASVRYVLLPYSTISDSTIELSDSDLEAYYDKTIKKYKQEASASIDYVTFDVTPSDVDRQAAVFEANKLAEEFKTAADDSVFVALNSDVPYSASFVKKGTLAPNLDSVMFNAPVGRVVGPYEENGSYRIARLSAVKMLPDSVKASHILLRVDPAAKDAIMARADSIKKALQGGADFKSLSDQYSTDEGAKTKGGDLGWFMPGMMVKEFNDACFEGRKGDYTIVETQFGVHIIHITDQGKPSLNVRVAYVDRKIAPSSKTYQSIYTKANDFAAKYTTAEDFDKGVSELKLTKMTEGNIMENSRQVGPLENSRELALWAFTSEIGTVSRTYEFGNRFVVAKLNGRREKGFSKIEEIREQLTAEVRREKKAEQLAEKMKKGGNSLESVSAAVGQPVMSGENVSFASPVVPSGMEPYLVGYLLAQKPGQVTPPLKGVAGVYMAQVVSFANVTMPANFSDAKKQLLSPLQSRSQYESFNALREKAGIVDKRSRFY